MTNPVLLFLVTAVAVVITRSFAATKWHAEGPWISPSKAPESSSPDGFTPEYRGFLEACYQRMTLDCADEIIGSVYRNKTHISKNCCTKLVFMGPDCHRALVEREIAHIKNRASKKGVVYRSEMTWRKCEKSVPRPQDRNYPRLPPMELRPGYEDFLRSCSKTLTNKCGLEIVDSLFQGKAMNRGCCEKIVKMGKLCYEEMLKGMRNIAENENELKEMKKMGHQIWYRCKKFV